MTENGKFPIETTIRHREVRSLTRFASGELLERVGLPTEVSYVHGRSEVASGAALYLGAAKLKPDGLFKGGYPVVVCELGDNSWHLLGVKKRPPEDPESQEFQAFCEQTLGKTDKTTLFTPYILEHFSQNAERKRNVVVTVYQKIFPASK